MVKQILKFKTLSIIFNLLSTFSGFTDKGSNDTGSNDTGSNDTGSNYKGSKVRQRVKRHRVKKCDKGANFLNFDICYSQYLFIFIQGQVGLRHFLGRALRLGHARWPSAAATVRLVKTLSGPSAAARTGQGAERCGHMVNYIHV